MMFSSHCSWVGGEASLHLNKTARRARREAKDKVRRFSLVNRIAPSMTPKIAASGFGSNLMFEMDF